MHEVSIAQSILDIATKECNKSGVKRINSIALRIGKASGINIDSLIFTFNILKKDTIADNAELYCDDVPVGGYCLKCKEDFTVDEEFILSCPICGEREFRVDRGREMEIIELDVD